MNTSNNKINEFADSIIPDNYKNHKVFAVMLFMTEMELNISQSPNKWINTKNYIFDGEDAGLKALTFYADTPCAASQLIDAPDLDELQTKMNDMLHNYQDENWLQENLYPYM